MKQGTWSVLLGCHSPIHSTIVIIAWRKWYRKWPAPWQIVCIMVHDIGHWGKNHLDNYEEKKKHAELGARIASRLFGEKGYNLVIGHCTYDGRERSELFYPDKYAQVISPVWWFMTNTWVEPKLIRPGHTRRESALMFKNAMIKNMANGFSEQGHDIYLRQWAGEERVNGGKNANKPNGKR